MEKLLAEICASCSEDSSSTSASHSSENWWCCWIPGTPMQSHINTFSIHLSRKKQRLVVAIDGISGLVRALLCLAFLAPISFGPGRKDTNGWSQFTDTTTNPNQLFLHGKLSKKYSALNWKKTGRKLQLLLLRVMQMEARNSAQKVCAKWSRSSLCQYQINTSASKQDTKTFFAKVPLAAFNVVCWHFTEVIQVCHLSQNKKRSKTCWVFALHDDGRSGNILNIDYFQVPFKFTFIAMVPSKCSKCHHRTGWGFLCFRVKFQSRRWYEGSQW